MIKNTVLVLAISAIAISAILGTPAKASATAGSSAPWIADLSTLQTTLQTQITNNLNSLMSGINDETAARKAGDAALSSQITDLSNLISNPPPKPSLTDAFLQID